MSEHSLPDTRQQPEPQVEKPDFPYYNGVPVWISGPRWCLVIGACAVAFAMLCVPIRWNLVTQFVPAVCLFAVPLGALAYVAPSGWRALFRKVRWHEVKLMIGIAALDLLTAASVAIALRHLLHANSNPVGVGLRHADWATRMAALAEMVPQLFGEEFLAIVPLLALMYLCHHKLGWSRRTALVLSWLVSSLIFGLLHLYTYDWNVPQCLVLIGGSRIVLTLGYVRTKNIWVSTGAHILNDLAIFSLSLLVA